MSQPGVVVVAPVFEDAPSLQRLLAGLKTALGPGLRAVVVDDGSVLAPVRVEQLRDAGVEGVVIQLKRNLGHQRAIAVGLSYAADHYPDCLSVIMDSDGEDRPETVPELLVALVEQRADVVVAQRRNRAEGLQFRAFYAVYKLVFKLLTGRAISFGNFMAITPAGLRRLTSMQELWIHVAGSVLLSRLRLDFRPIDRGTRYAGESRMNFVSLALHGFRALMVFAEDVLVRVGIACTLVAALSIIGGLAAVVLKVLGIATPGWFSVAIGILFLVFLQTGTLTLVTLMLTGIVRGGAVSRTDYRDFVAAVLVPARD
jgi:glycosyltransferase involved in cell wall biosynthesis